MTPNLLLSISVLMISALRVATDRIVAAFISTSKPIGAQQTAAHQRWPAFGSRRS